MIGPREVTDPVYAIKGSGWRAPRYRLMRLAQTGRAHPVATGNLDYLSRLARKSLPQSRGRFWIEMNVQPASTLTIAKWARNPALGGAA